MAIIYTYNLIVLTQLKGPPHSKNEFTKNHWANFICKLLLNGASHDTKIGCNSLVWAGANKYKFLIFAMRRTFKSGL